MKRLLSLLVAAGFAASAAAGNLTQENTGKAREIIAAAVAAHGGDALTGNLKTLVIEHETILHSVHQSRGTEPSWDSSDSAGFDAIDVENAIFVTHGESSAGGFENNTRTIINGDDSVRIDYRAGTVASIAEPDYATTSGPFVRVTPALLLRTLNQRRANAYYLGEAPVDGVAHDVIGFSMSVGPAITLYFDQTTRLLARSERVLPRIGLVEYEFSDYERIDGVAVNRSFRLYLNGDRNIERSNVSIGVNAALATRLAVSTDLDPIPAIEPDPLSRREIADGVWLIGGTGTYAMFVDLGDYIVAAGGTAGIPARIASLREVVGDKPIRYAMMTHHHFDHVMGVSAWENEDATLIAAAAHEPIVRGAAEDGEALDVMTVGDPVSLAGGGRRVEIFDLGATVHSEHLLVAWLPGEGILFEADHFGLPQNGPVPPAVSSTRSFAEALARHDLEIKKIVSAHSPRLGSLQDLERALAAEAVQARR